MQTIFNQVSLGGSFKHRANDFFNRNFWFITILLVILALRIWGLVWALKTINQARPGIAGPLIVLIAALVVGIDVKQKR